nr:putative RNA-directed DNA polymerase [Tanacetum cinerariifolium]
SWYSVNFEEPNLSSSTTIVEVPKELPKVSTMNSSLKKLKFHLTSFDVVVKERTTATAITEDTWGFEHTKACFRDEIIPFVKPLKDLFNSFDQFLIDELTEVQNVFNKMEQAVEQHCVEKNKFQNKMNDVLKENERLLEQAISADISMNECERCVTIETKHQKDFINKECYDTLFKQYITLKKHCISLEVDSQLKQELFQRNNLFSQQSAPTFDQLFEINDLKAKIKKELEEIKTINIELDHRVTKLVAKNKHLKQTYKQLYESIKSSRVRSKEQCDDLIKKVNIKSAKNSDLNVSLQEKVLVITALKEKLSKLKRKAVVNEVVTLHPIDPELLKIDVAPLAPKLRNNMTSHNDYLKHTQEETATVREIIKNERLLNPLSTSLDYMCKYTKRIQELLIIIKQTCPCINDLGTKQMVVTPKNNDKKIRFTEHIPSSGNTPVKTTSSTNELEEIKTINIELDHRVTKLVAKNKHLKQTYKKLYESIKSSRVRSKEQCDDLIKQVNIKSAKNSDLNASLQEKVLVITALKEKLSKLKGKAVVNEVVTLHPIDPELLKIDVAPLAPKLRNNRTSHNDYLKHTQEETATVREIIKNERLLNPLSTSLDYTESHKPKSKDTNQEKLSHLHMVLCGRMRVKSVNEKKYILVIVDDYSRFTWVKCLRSKDEALDFIIKFLKMIQVRLKVTVRHIRTDNGIKFVNQTLHEYYEEVGISHETSVARSPQQNDVVERHNRTLIEAACTMLIYAQASLFLLAEAVTTACYTQNRSIIRLRHEKTPYELLHNKLPDLSFLRVFGALCYPTNDSDNLEKLQPKMTLATISSRLVQKSSSSTPYVPPSRNDWDLLFQPMFDELLNPPPSVDHHAPEVIALMDDVIPPVQDDSTGSPSSTTVDQDAPSKLHLLNLHQRPVSTRLQLHEQALFCYYDAFLSLVEPKTYKDALTQSCWIEAMQVEINEFERLEARHTKKHVHAVKRIFRYLCGTVHQGLWYLKDSSVALTAISDADHAGCQDTHRSTSGSVQFLGERLISWSSKMKKSDAISSAEAEYIAVSGC